MLPAILRAGIPGRDPQRELRLEWVQLRELTRYLLSQINERAPMSDILGFTENLERRLAAHQNDLESIYFEAAAPRLTAGELKTLLDAAPPP